MQLPVLSTVHLKALLIASLRQSACALIFSKFFHHLTLFTIFLTKCLVNVVFLGALVSRQAA